MRLAYKICSYMTELGPVKRWLGWAGGKCIMLFILLFSAAKRKNQMRWSNLTFIKMGNRIRQLCCSIYFIL